MASGAAAGAVAVKLTIPNKAVHLNERDTLSTTYIDLQPRIQGLIHQHNALKKIDPTNITLDDAITILDRYQDTVNQFNQLCVATQTEINTNNQALQDLLDRIKIDITKATAEKAAADAAAAAAAAKTAAEEAAALQTAKDSLQEYITSLETQLRGINDNKLDDISAQIKDHANTINQYDTQLDTAAPSSDKAISQATRDLIAAFEKDTVKEVTTKTQEFNTLNEDFGRAKNANVTDLEARIQSLEYVAVDANVTAKQINDALEADTQKPIDDKKLGEIKGSAAALAAEFGTKVATEFATRKVEIEGKIEKDKASFQEKQKIIDEYQRIMDILDSKEVKEKEAAIQENIKNAQAAEKAALDTNLSNLFNKLNMNLRFQQEIGQLNASILSLQTELQKKKLNLDTKLQELQTKSADIQLSPPIDVAPIQRRIDALKETNAEYERLVEAQKARAAELSAEKEAARSRSPSPVLSPGSPPKSRREAAQQRGRPETPLASDSEQEQEGPDTQSTSLMNQLKNRQRSRPQFQSASVLVKRRYVYIPPSFNASDPIYLIDLPEGDSGGGAAAGTADKGGGKIIQHGGQPPQSLPTGAVIYELNPTYEDNILLLASLKSAKDVLNDNVLIQNLERKATKQITDTSEVSDTYTKIQKQLISSDDTGILTIARRAVYKSSIMKLMAILDSKIPRESGLLSYTVMYSRLWTFMNPNDAVGIIKELKDAQTESNFVKVAVISKIVGWTTETSTNPNLDTYFDVFINCGRRKSTFLTEVTQRVDKMGIPLPLQKEVAYRFKLNWIILIAFYCRQTFPTKIVYANVGELIINTYETFLGWMEKDKQTYVSMFLNGDALQRDPKDIYSKRILSNIERNINKDHTLTLSEGSLKTRITEKLCEGQMTNDAKIHENEPDEELPKDGQPSGKPLSDGKVFERVSKIAATTSLNPTAKQNNQTGGHKRTRKHRTPASSTPAPATRRHRDQSSSSHKRTRRYANTRT
jgi:hypothetical protein